MKKSTIFCILTYIFCFISGNIVGALGKHFHIQPTITIITAGFVGGMIYLIYSKIMSGKNRP
jgi:uncharacterized membrane protein SpoIIM required for sporulation